MASFKQLLRAYKPFLDTLSDDTRASMITSLKNDANKYGKYAKLFNIRKVNLHYFGNEDIAYGVSQMTSKNKTQYFDIRDISQAISDDIAKNRPDDDIKIGIVLKTPWGWRGGKFTKVGEKVDMYDPSNYYDVEEDNNIMEILVNGVYEYIIYLRNDGPKNKAGGKTEDKKNNCLHYCLMKAYGGYEFLPPKVKYANKMKRRLGLQECDKVSVEKVIQLQDIIKSRIDICGDYVYKSDREYKRLIQLRLYKEHYELYHMQRVKTKNNFGNQERKIIFYHVEGLNKSENNVKTYDGSEIKYITRDELKKHTYGDKDNIYIKSDTIKSIIQEYDDFIETANQLKDKTLGKINMFKSGGFRDTSMRLFDQVSKHIDQGEKIEQYEMEFLEGCKSNGLIFGEYDYTCDNAYQYDGNSWYPSQMMKTFNFPVKPGELLTIKQEDFNSLKFYKYGIYHAIVYKTNSNTDKLLLFNPKNYYTHLDMMLAKKLNMKIEIIDDGKPNFLFYDTSKRIQFKDTFEKYINILYNLKKEKVKGAKILMNTIWGALCERYDRYCVIDMDNTDVTVNEFNKPLQITSITPMTNNKIKIEYSYYDEYYKTNYARLKPFLTAIARTKLAEILSPNIDHIIRTHTDGFISDIPINNITLGVELGQFKLEHENEKCYINYPHGKVKWN